MPDIRHPIGRNARDQKDVEARLVPKEADEKQKMKKDVLERVIQMELYIALSKFLVPFLIVPLLLNISWPILRKYTEEGSFVRELPFNIIIYFGVPFFFFYLGKTLEKNSWRKRFQSGKFESSKSIEELEKREKTLQTRNHYWNCAIWILNGLIIGLVAPSMIRNIIWPPQIVRDYPNQWIASICFN